ncbi:hypothetical protein DWW97_04220 [Dorea longicatena]|uniref:HD domain-containing protein n=1 Tax=Dorea longicatena TaxID=88431 RepID=UPI000E478BBB|nr:hypothetical protein [Dorea longicatena]RGU08310.1 hypothetical protein DWW97_04220 [Dorea longicatena]
MKIQERITTLTEEIKDDNTTSLWRVCRGIVENVSQHNKQIIAQMRDYDTHDKEHSEKVLEIIEDILGQNMEKLTVYELLLLYMSAYLHDSAMALPDWEYKVLKAVEGTEEYHDNTLEFTICNDYKPKHTYSEALRIIKENKDKLFCYDTAKNYVCAKPTEDKMTESLAEFMQQYEEFRNGYITDLDKCKGSVSEYMDKSRWIRSEFIRQTHHIRAVENVESLKGKIADAIGGFYAEKFIEDLAAICRCHGENLESVFQLPDARKDWLGGTANIQFLAMMLRLGDVIHFDSKRAPRSLYAEKQITDAVSYKHWNAKFQELQYKVQNTNGKVIICYQAYCEDPEMYYFIQDYMGWINNEIDNYYVLKNRWEMNQSSENGQYCFNIEKVDRTDIGYDKDQFVPDNDMKFVLNQSKILELLMGIQLYKDPFLCLREIYQNALDASKCMKAYNKKKGKTENLTIEFGIGEEDLHGKKERYIYCLDHGTGMNAYIIKNYLLHIGNSYYRSKDFAKQNTDWGYDVKPTSQFGIGLLSGYMLADKIGITTIHYEESGNALSFMMEGVNEHFYYTKPKRTEAEAIGDHGTLVKLYLKEEYRDKVNAEYIPKLPLALMCDNDDDDIEDELGQNLFYILNRHIGIKCSEISVMICDAEGNERELYYCNSIFDQKNYNEISDEEMKNVFEKVFYLSGDEDLIKIAIGKKKQIENYVIKVTSENMELYSHVAFPKKGIGEYKGIFDYVRFLGNVEESIYVDGILIERERSIRLSGQLEQVLKDDILKDSIINYVGSKRPILSVDRNSCVAFPNMELELEIIKDGFVEELCRIITKHILKEHMSTDDPEQLMILDIIARKFPSILEKLLRKLKISQNMKITLDKNFVEKNKYILDDIFSKEQLWLNDVDFRSYMEITRQTILGRSITADEIKVEDLNVIIRGGKCQEVIDSTYMNPYYEQMSLEIMAICADEWKGRFREYDIVNKIWPVVNQDLYKCLNCEGLISERTNRCKMIYDMDEIIEIANLDPVLVHPVYGISSRGNRRFEDGESQVGEFYKNQRKYKLNEMTGYGRLTSEKKVSYALYVYIASRDLDETDQQKLEEYKEKDPDYVRGVKEGWSILFLGECQKYVICPGIVPRAEMAQKVKEDYRKLTPDITYLYSDGIKVFDE